MTGRTSVLVYRRPAVLRHAEVDGRKLFWKRDERCNKECDYTHTRRSEDGGSHYGG